MSIKSDTPLIVGYVVEKGYEITKDAGTIYMGTSDTPHSVGGSPGMWKEFDPANGSVSVRFENTSSIKTKLAIYTKTKN